MFHTLVDKSKFDPDILSFYVLQKLKFKNYHRG